MVVGGRGGEEAKVERVGVRGWEEDVPGGYLGVRCERVGGNGGGEDADLVVVALWCEGGGGGVCVVGDGAGGG